MSKILLAEDDEDDKEFIKLAFNQVAASHQLLLASNGREALEELNRLSISNQLPCLIVLDLNMPVMNGVQTLEELNNRPQFRHIPKVIFTTSESEQDRFLCFSKGATDYMVKPANMREIMQSVQTMLDYCD